MRTLQFGLRVADRAASVAFYTTLGYDIVGEVADSPIGHLTMLKLPDDEFVALELVDDSTGDSSAPGFSHFAVHVESLDSTLERLATSGIHPGTVKSPAPNLHTASISDPDGRKIELVQWPPLHAAGMTATDWPEQTNEDR